jgi:hypothetical protein
MSVLTPQEKRQMEVRNAKRAAAATKALTAGGFETEPGFCLRWVRQVQQHEFGEEAWPVPRGLSAAQAYDWLDEHGLIQPIERGTLPGDIVFFVGFEHGKAGHVAIRIWRNLYAENSSVHWGGDDHDARGTRPLHSIRWPTGFYRP